MRVAVSRCLIVFLLLAVVCAGETGRNHDSVITMRFLEISPTRSIPIVFNTSRATEVLRRHAGEKGPLANVRQSRLKKIDGWQAEVPRSRHIESFDDYRLVIETNDPAMLRRNVRAVFRTLGFLPVDPFSGYDRPGETSISMMFYEDIVFVYGGAVTAIVLRRSAADAAYRFVGDASITTGRILKKELGGRRLFYFKEDHVAVLAQMRREYPTAKVLLLWDDSGTLALDVGYDYLEWGAGALMIHRNTVALEAPCGRGSSSWNCQTSGNACQLSLLNALTHEPTVLTTTLTVSYEGSKLRPTAVSLGVVPATSPDTKGITCQSFRTVDEILAAKDFGVCGRNLDFVPDYRCLGNAEDYLKESWAYSRHFWSSLYSFLNENKFAVPVDVDPILGTSIAEFWQTCTDCPLDPRAAPHGLGYAHPLGLLRTVILPSRADAPQSPSVVKLKEPSASQHLPMSQIPHANAKRTAEDRARVATDGTRFQALPNSEFLTADGKPVKGIQVMLEPLLLWLRVVAEDVGAERMYDIVMMQRGKEVARHTITAARQNGTLAPPGKAVYEASFYLTVPHLPGNEACDPSIPKLMSPGGLVDIVASKPSASEPPPKPRK